MKTTGLAVVLALVLPVVTTAAHADDAAYCKALVAKYRAFIIKTGGHSPSPGTADGSVAVDQCLSGNPAGIPVLEQKLRDAKIDLPSRS